MASHDFTFRGWLLGNSHSTTADKAERRLAARTDGQKESPLGGLWESHFFNRGAGCSGFN